MGLQRVRHCKINYLFPLKSTISCTTCVLSHFSCVWLFDIVWTVSHQAHLPGASVRNPAHGKGHEEGSPTKCKGVIWLQGFPLSFPEHQPPKTRVGLILLYCAFPLFWHSLEKVNLGLQSSAFERNLSAQTPSDASLTCLTGSPGLLTTCELFTVPQPQEAQSLKHLKDTQPFLKS